MQEILPGLFHWTAVHPRIRIAVSSYYVPAAGVLIDPLIPAEGLDGLRAHGTPRHVLLTNRHHYRESGGLERAFGCTVWCHQKGLHEFTRGERVQGFRPGDTLPGGIESHAVGAICPDETALRIPLEPAAALAVADGVVRDGDGPLAFVPNPLLGDDPEGVKQGLKRAYARLLALDFDHLLPAHGLPWVGGGKDALRRFVED